LLCLLDNQFDSIVDFYLVDRMGERAYIRLRKNGKFLPQSFKLNHIEGFYIRGTKLWERRRESVTAVADRLSGSDGHLRDLWNIGIGPDTMFVARFMFLSDHLKRTNRTLARREDHLGWKEHLLGSLHERSCELTHEFRSIVGSGDQIDLDAKFIIDE